MKKKRKPAHSGKKTGKGSVIRPANTAHGGAKTKDGERGLYEKQYLRVAVIFAAVFAGLAALGAVMSFILWNRLALDMGMMIGLSVGAVICSPPIAYSLVCYLYFTRKFENEAVETADAVGFRRGRFLIFCSLVVNCGGREYLTPSFFLKREAEALVGKTVPVLTSEDRAFVV